ncbi:MAG: AAA family ATPase, partial [Bdellovibrionota bacterium]
MKHLMQSFDFKTTLTSCQQAAFDALTAKGNVFLTGGAGSGKSFLVRHFMRTVDTKEFPILASTGAAAVLVGGRTFHSFFGLGIMEGGVAATIEKASRNRQVVRRLKKIKGFIVDEVSMLSGATLHAAEIISRRVRGSDLPWGGMRVIAVGDFAQLPPVERGQNQHAWAFLDPVWEFSGFQTHVLKTQTRCKDDEYMKILAQVREGNVTPDVKAYLDKKVTEVPPDFDGTRLFPRRDQTDFFNTKRLNELEGEEKVFETIYSGDTRSVETLKRNSPLPDVLRIKEGALVMLRQNDPMARFVNGSTGHVERIQPHSIKVRLLNGRSIDLEKTSFSLMDAEGETIAAAVQKYFGVSLDG